jgi:VWFA-related protein
MTSGQQLLWILGIRWGATRSPLSLMLVAVLALCSCFAASGQQTALQPNASQSGYTIKADSRVVLTDVTVMDEAGNPVRGLRASNFQVFDNKEMQQISSFEEHRRQDSSTAASHAQPAGVYSNQVFEHPPAAWNVVLLDITRLQFEDQVLLRHQLDQFVGALKPDTPVALYGENGTKVILLQSFTSDAEVLHTTISTLLPSLPLPHDAYPNDLGTLTQLAGALSHLPGRKNVLWFSGRPQLGFTQNGLVVVPQLQPIYDELESQRIALYPVDARGLTVSTDAGLGFQHLLLKQSAEATGGRAVYNTNALGAAAAAIVSESSDFYTLTYTPRRFSFNNKWHSVRVQTTAGYYTLRYRGGYFADGTRTEQERAGRTRTRLLAGGTTEGYPPGLRVPLIFQASVTQGIATAAARDAENAGDADRSQAALPKGSRPFVVNYTLPLDSFQITNTDGRSTLRCGAAVYALNRFGTLVYKRALESTYALTSAAAEQPAGRHLSMDVQIGLKPGELYLYILAWDIGTRRTGSVAFPIHVPSGAGPF